MLYTVRVDLEKKMGSLKNALAITKHLKNTTQTRNNQIKQDTVESLSILSHVNNGVTH